MTVSAIPALSKIQCDVAPTVDSDLANKKYVDDAVASASGGGGSSDHLTVGNSISVYGPDLVDASTYLVPQTAVAAEYSASQTYNIGDVCVYHGELWKRQMMSGSGTAPSAAGMLWVKTTLSALLAEGGGPADVPKATLNASGYVDMTGNPGVIDCTGLSSMIGVLGLDLRNVSISGMLSVEVHITGPLSISDLTVKINGTSYMAVWFVGHSAADLNSSGIHVIRIRKFASGSMVYVEYVGVYGGESGGSGTIVIPDLP